MRTLLVGERMNDPLASINSKWDPKWWYYRAMERGVFEDAKLPQNVRSKAKLASVGVTHWDASLNLCPPAPQGTPWDPEFARDVAQIAWHSEVAGAVFLTLGDRVRRAVFGEPIEWGVPRSLGRGHTIIAVPHPSGLSRFWNDADAVAQLREKVCTSLAALV